MPTEVREKDEFMRRNNMSEEERNREDRRDMERRMFSGNYYNCESPSTQKSVKAFVCGEELLSISDKYCANDL